MNADLGAQAAYAASQAEAAEAARQARVFFNSCPGRLLRRFVSQ